MIEHWRAVPGFEGSYEVSDLGRVRSLDRIDRRGHAIKGRVLKPWFAGPMKYHAVYLCNGRSTPAYVHDLVLAAFVGPKPAGVEACHNRGRVTENQLANLRYDTPVENQRDKVAHGTDQFGERNTQAKLTANEVLKIRASLGRVSHSRLAVQFGVRRETIGKIARGERWVHV